MVKQVYDKKTLDNDGQQTFHGRHKERADEEVAIATLPVSALESTGFSANNQPMGMHDINLNNNTYAAMMHVGRNEPFPCFKKERWEGQGIVKIIQSY